MGRLRATEVQTSTHVRVSGVIWIAAAVMCCKIESYYGSALDMVGLSHEVIAVSITSILAKRCPICLRRLVDSQV